METDGNYVLTEKIIGFAMKVHRALGAGFLESVYLKAFAYELRRAGFSVELGQRISVRYENVIVGDFVADLVINDNLICELKATSALTKADEVQLVNYLTATNRDYGLLFNFGSAALQFKRKHRRPASHAEDADLQSSTSR